MDWVTWIIAVVLTGSIIIGLIALLRWFAGRGNPSIFTFVPAQRQAYITTKSIAYDKSDVTDETERQGNIVDVIHAAPGKWLDKSSADMMDWCYKDEDQDHREPRGLLYLLLGITFIGFFRYLRLNKVRTFRWGRNGDESEYHMTAPCLLTRFPYFSGQHDIQLKSIETGGILKLDLRLNLLFEETFPVRVRLVTADPYAVMTVMTSKRTIGLVGGYEDPKELVQKEELQEELARLIEKDVREVVLNELGITIRKVTLADIDFDEETKELLEKKARAELEAEANLITAKNEAAQTVARAAGQKEAQMLINKGDADRVETVIKPAATSELTVRVREAEAYERNQKVTVFAPGSRTMVPVSPTE